MRVFQSLLRVIVIFAISFSVASAQNYVFYVLNAIGDVKVKKGTSSAWVKLKTGENLFEKDKIKLAGSNSFVALRHQNGNTLQVRDLKEFSVPELVTKIKSSTVTGRMTRFILDEMKNTNNLFSDKNYNMDVTGSVERGSEGLPFIPSTSSFKINSPRKVSFSGNKVKFNWFKSAGENNYKLFITDRFDRPVYSADVKDTSVTLDADNIKLQKDTYYFWHVTGAANKDLKSEDGCFLVLSNESYKIVTDSLNLLKAELGDENDPVNMVFLGYYYEQNNMFYEAFDCFRRAVDKTGNDENYREIYDSFLKRNNVKPQ